MIPLGMLGAAAPRGAGGGGSPLVWRSPPAAQWALSNSGKTATVASSNTLIVASGAGVSSGKRYFEIRLGAGAFGNAQFGIKPASVTGIAPFVGDNGSPPSGWALAHFGSKVYNNSYSSIGLGFGQNSTLRVAVDFATSSVWFGVNGTWSGDPAAGTGAAFTNVTVAVSPAVNLTSSAPVTLRTVAADLEYSPPSGFSPWVD